jgi:hypothetical protein
MSERELIDMQLHERKSITDAMAVIRVIGGWIYELAVVNADGNYIVTSTFVPEEG